MLPPKPSIERSTRRARVDLALATGDRVRLFRRTWGSVEARNTRSATTATSSKSSHKADGLRVRTEEGGDADIDWRRLADKETGRLLSGWAMR